MTQCMTCKIWYSTNLVLDLFALKELKTCIPSPNFNVLLCNECGYVCHESCWYWVGVTHRCNYMTFPNKLRVDFHVLVVQAKDIRHCQSFGHDLLTFCYLSSSLWSKWLNIWENISISTFFGGQTWKFKFGRHQMYPFWTLHEWIHWPSYLLVKKKSIMSK